MTVTSSQYNFYPVLTPVRLVSQLNIAGTYFNGQINNGVGATLTTTGSLTAIDSVNLNVNDRVLLENQTNKNENGIYIVTSIGAVTVLTRSADFQNIEQLKAGQFVLVGAGSILAGSLWVLVEPLPARFGIDNINFAL